MKPIALVVVLLLALAGGGYYLFSDPGTGQEEETSQPEVPPKVADEGKADIEDRKKPVEEKGREETPEPIRVSQASNTPESYPQGIEGQVLSNAGGPVRDAEVYLLQGVDPGNMIAQLAQLGAGGRIKAKIAAECKTDGRGAFKLGAPATQGGGGYELRIKAPGHVVHERKLRLMDNQWQKLGLIQLERGRVLTGSVRDAVTKTNVVDAIVRVKLTAMNFMAPTPGLEEGIETVTDSNGRYELAGLPAGPMELVALAKGYGTFTKTDLLFEETELNKSQDIELPKGFEIEGWVTDAEGNPVPKARVEAVPFSQNLPTGHSYSDADGRYAIFGLGDGEYIVSAEARGFVRNERKPIKAGSEEIQIILETQGQLRIRVVSKRGRAITRYRAELKRFFPENPENFGRADVPAIEVRAPKNGEYLLQGINPGNYVLQIDATQFAKTYSKNFTVEEGQTEPLLVEVTMNEGAVIYGIVTDSGGMPIKNASVSTLEESFQDNPLMKMFRPLMTVRITERTIVTDNKGRFRVEKLTPAKYQLKVDHPEFTRAYFKGFEVTDGQKLDVGFLKLKAGGIVHGKVYGPGGQAIAGAKVTISSMEAESQIFEQVFTDAKGNFKVGRPLPSGKYELQATRTDHANPLMQLADIQNSKTEINVQRGMGPVVVHIKKK